MAGATKSVKVRIGISPLPSASREPIETEGSLWAANTPSGSMVT